MTSRSRVRAISAAVLATTSVAVLAGCSGGGGSGPTPSPTPIGKPVSQTCAELLPLESLAVYGQAFEQVASYRPAKGTPAARIVQQQGRACQFREVSDHSVTISFAVADLPEKSLTNLKDALYQRGGSVPTYTVEGYFDLADDGVGRADAFADPYWITASSTLFTEPGGAQPVVDAVRGVVKPATTK
ncbi:hypothetical protein [Curtobacterium luteum]|uniref:DUF3558 domain-containing protein n=1 Tax=Curtobacterium luteum TaxID=33881 RepID=A0A175RKM7_9MICO|nr:hypothetical protein [Curtobacterium luteum]KTR03961.1 hypothetical protein NS184_12800 [Curtobacterium luteum]